jgi:hypothetical protein
MSPIGAASWSLQVPAENAGWRVRALQKPGTTSDLYGKQKDKPQGALRPQNKNPQGPMPHYETESYVPFRHAPCLTAPFTAQLLGQIMPDPERPPSAASRYAGETLRLSLGIDKRL